MSHQENQKKVIHGFCHDLSPEIRVPFDIIRLCISFHGLLDEWDPNAKSGRLRLFSLGNHQNVLVRHPAQERRHECASVFGRKACASGSGVHEWVLRVVESKRVLHENYSVVVGVTKNEFVAETVNESAEFKHPGGTHAQYRLPVAFMRFNGVDRGHGFVANKARKMLKSNENEHGLCRYGQTFKETNDTMTVRLNMDDHTLSFTVNGTDYGKAFDVEPDCEYRLALCILPGITIQICEMDPAHTECTQIAREIRERDASYSSYFQNLSKIKMQCVVLSVSVLVLLIAVAFAFYP